VIGGLCQNVHCEGKVKTFTAFGREIYHVFAVLLTLQVAYSLKNDAQPSGEPAVQHSTTVGRCHTHPFGHHV
jgi:hypothetical protein